MDIHINLSNWHIYIYNVMPSLVDIVIIFIILLGALAGYRKGFFKQLASLLGLILGLIAAYFLCGVVADKIYNLVTDNMTLAQIMAFVAIWLFVPLMCMLIASILTNALEVLSLGWLNRLLGLVLGGFKWLLLIALFIFLFDYLDLDEHFISGTMKDESMLYYPVKHVVEHIIDMLPSMMPETIF